MLVLSYPVDPIAAPQVKELKTRLHTLEVNLVHDIRSADDLPAAFDAGVRWHAEGLLTTTSSIFVAQRKRVIDLAAQHRLPALYPYGAMVDSGGLMAYDAYTPDLLTYRRLCAQDPEGRQTGRVARRAADEVRVGHQPQDGPRARPHDTGGAPPQSRSGDRMTFAAASNMPVERSVGSHSLATAAHWRR